MAKALAPFYDKECRIICMTLIVPANAPRGWQKTHPLAGYAQFRWSPGRWVGGHGNLNDPCRWQEGHWVVIPIFSQTSQKDLYGLKADPEERTFCPGEGCLYTVASDLRPHGPV